MHFLKKLFPSQQVKSRPLPIARHCSGVIDRCSVYVLNDVLNGLMFLLEGERVYHRLPFGVFDGLPNGLELTQPGDQVSFVLEPNQQIQRGSFRNLTLLARMRPLSDQ
jgi:hypothetical protein